MSSDAADSPLEVTDDGSALSSISTNRAALGRVCLHIWTLPGAGRGAAPYHLTLMVDTEMAVAGPAEAGRSGPHEAAAHQIPALGRKAALYEPEKETSMRTGSDALSHIGDFVYILAAFMGVIILVVIYKWKRQYVLKLVDLIRHRTEYWFLFVFCLFIPLALLTDLHIIKWKPLNLLEELLEMNAGLALLFYCLSLKARNSRSSSI